MRVEIRSTAFDPWRELANYEAGDHLASGSYGACATFVGTMRDFNQGESVNSLYLEHYEGMTEKLLEEEARRIKLELGLLDFLVLHRIGEILPKDPIVLVAGWAAHRAPAFDGCRALMEYLKSKATFWKKETLVTTDENNQRWVDNVS